jgi:hypothetical protein
MCKTEYLDRSIFQNLKVITANVIKHHAMKTYGEVET